MPRVSLEYERSSGGALTYVRLSGKIDESFDGRRAAQRINSERALINCAGLTLITSYGLRQWMEFLQELDSRKVRVFYVECSPKFVEELNHVVGLAEKATVLSAYAPYECPTCRFSHSVLLRMDTDAEVVRSRQPPSFSCMTCGGAMEFDDNPAAYFAGLEPFVHGSPDETVLSFLEARLGYGTEVERQLQIQKLIEGETTVLWFGGTLDSTLNGARLAEGLQGNVVVNLSDIIHVQQGGIRAWREFIKESAGRCKLFLIGCPALVIERALEGVEEQSGIEVVSVRIPYACAECGTTEFVVLDLTTRAGAEVRQAELPVHKCAGCKAETQAMVGPSLLTELAKLPKPSPPHGLGRLLKRASKQIQAKRAAKRPPERGRRSLTPWAAAAAATIVVGIGAAVGASYVLRSGQKQAVATTTPNTQRPASSGQTERALDRPEWITSDVPSSSYCFERGQTLSCVGVSAYWVNREDAEEEAFDAALEALVHGALLNAQGESAKLQRDSYLDARTEALEALEEARYATERTQPFEYARKRRRMTAEVLRRQRPPGAPTQRSSWHWEEYESSDGIGTEFLVFVRVDTSRAEREALVDYYTSPQQTSGSTLLPAHPGLVWAVDLSDSSAFLVRWVGPGLLRQAGVKPADLLLVPGDVGADELHTVLEEASESRGKDGVLIRRGKQFSETQKLWARAPTD